MTGHTPPKAERQPHAVVTHIALPTIVVDRDLALLTDAERARAERFHFERDRAAFVTTRASLRRLLAHETRVPAGELDLGADDNGRPFWADAASDPPDRRLDFNVSHSGLRALIGLVRGRRIGVDIEWHGRQRSLRELEAQVMGHSERAMLRDLDEEAHLRAFLGCWTRKEALVKAIGLGLSYPVTTIDLPAVPADGLVRLGESPAGIWSIMTEGEREYTVSVAVAGRGTAISFQDDTGRLSRA